jgi:hypothetical protein
MERSKLLDWDVSQQGRRMDAKVDKNEEVCVQADYFAVKPNRRACRRAYPRLMKNKRARISRPVLLELMKTSDSRKCGASVSPL